VDAAHILVVGGATGETKHINLQTVQPVYIHFSGQDLLQPQTSSAAVGVTGFKVQRRRINLKGFLYL